MIHGCNPNYDLQQTPDKQQSVLVCVSQIIPNVLSSWLSIENVDHHIYRECKTSMEDHRILEVHC